MPVSTAATAMYSTVQTTSEAMMPIGHVALRVAGLLGVGRDRVEADVGEEDHRGPGQHAERLPARAGLPASVWPKKLSPV